MSNKETYKITITNFFKHNPKTKKSFTHFMLAKNYFFDSKIVQLKPNESQLFLYLCSIACDLVSNQFEISAQSLPKQFRISAKSLLNHLNRLQYFQLLSYEKKELLYNRIEENRKEKKIIIHDQSVKTDMIDSVKFNFDLIYKKFPRKEGKSRGLKICKIQIKTYEDFDKLSKAVENYSNYCLKNVRELKYIKHFSTFMGEWRDWIDFKENKEIEMTEAELNKFYGVE